MKVLVKLIYWLLYALSLLPLRVLYVFSDVLYLVAYRIVGYRKRVVRSNLSSSFPGKSEAELRQVERRFYHWFCDYIVETVKLLSISANQLRRRMEFRGIEKVNECLGRGQSCAIFLGHYCNWEWVTSLQLWTLPGAQCCQVYHVLENRHVDNLFLKLRERFNSLCIPMAETLRELVRYRQKGQPVVIGYISDQVPYWNNIHHWLTFLRQDTPVLTGTERIAAQTGHAVFYIDVTRPRRGYYRAELVPITLHPDRDINIQEPIYTDEMGHFKATDHYIQLLETQIRECPELWLWTHDRWKRTYNEWLQREAIQ